MVKSTALPLPLVQETGGVYTLCEEGKHFLECLSEDIPLAVVVVAGRYRTGKSFLLNRGLLPDAVAKKGFMTGNSIHSCTRGVWIYPTPLSTHDNRCYVVLDTEGTASLEAKAEHDARLIGIALSLASVFIFNSSGALDETSLSDLATLTSVAQGITAESDKWQPPELIWVLRDFALQLQGDDGEDITPQDYLERALSEEHYGKGGVRATLKHFFQKRTLHTMVRPCTDEAQLQNLNGLSSSFFRPEFKKQLVGFREIVKLAATRPKEIGGISLNGPALAKLVAAAIASVNDGKAPSIQTTFDFLQERRAKEFEDETLADLQRDAFLAKETLPTADPLMKLRLPMKPSFMHHLPELWKSCEERLLKRHAVLVRELEDANVEAQTKVTREAFANATSGDVAFSESMEALTAKLGAEKATAVAPRLHEIYLKTAEDKRRVAEEKVADAEKLVATLHTELLTVQKAHAAMQEEMDEALVRTAQAAGVMSHEEYAQTLAETRYEAQHEMNALSEARDALSVELRRLLMSQESCKMAEEARFSRAEEDSRALRSALIEAELHRDRLAAEAESVAGSEKPQRSDLEDIKADFEVIVRQCEARAFGACDDRDRAQKRCEDAEFLLAEERKRVGEEVEMLKGQREAARREQEEVRRKQTQDLLQKRQQLAEAYSGIMQDSQRAREASLSSDRKLMMMEVEKDSLKRRVESLENDSQELSKTRRLYDDVRFKHVSAEATVEASVKVQEMQKSQLQRLETELREVRATAQQRDLETTRKTATLELQLQARGIALT